MALEWLLFSHGSNFVNNTLLSDLIQFSSVPQLQKQQILLKFIRWNSQTYEVTVNTDLVIPELLLLGEKRLRCLRASGHIFMNPSIRNLGFCVLLFKEASFSMQCCFIIIALTASSPTTHAWTSLSNTGLSFIRHIPAFLSSEALDSISALCLGAFFHSKISNKKHKDVETVAVKRLQQKDTGLQSELKQEGRALLCSTLAGNVQVGT